MSDQPGHLLDSLTGRQRLFDRFERIEKLLVEERERSAQHADRIARGIEELGQRIDRIERRLEEAISYFAWRSNRLVDSQAVYLGDHVAITFLESGIRILVDTRSIDIGVHLLTLGRWEPAYTALFTRLVKPGDRVLDLGANHGVYALLAAQIVGPTGHVDAFEPNPRLARLVDLSFRLNGFSWARLHQVGVSEASGTARLVFSDSFSGGGSVALGDAAAGTRQGVDCRLVALDEMFADPAIAIDVMKIDVEGHEGRALRGMRKLLERSPWIRIMMEFGPEMMRGAGVSAAEVAGFLEGLGLSAWTIGAEGEITPTSWAELGAQTDGLQNILVAREAPAL